MADNEHYFVYGPSRVIRAAVVAEQPFVREVLRLAVAPDGADTNVICDVLEAAQLPGVDWGDYGLLLWQGTLPRGEAARPLHGFVEDGGVLLCLPPGKLDVVEGEAAGWGEVQESGTEAVFAVGTWEEGDGPLERSEEGYSLPLRDLEVRRRQPSIGEGRGLAWFEDGTPLLSRRVQGRGQALYLSTLPRPDWSRLHDGGVLVPVVQRLLAEGARRLSLAREADCGRTLSPPGRGVWTAVMPPGLSSPGPQAAVYQAGPQWLALQRPASEDERDQLSAEEAAGLFAGVPFQMFEEQQEGAASVQSELWRTFLVVMLMFLLAEAVLILPPRSVAIAWSAAPSGGVPGGKDSARESSPPQLSLS